MGGFRTRLQFKISDYGIFSKYNPTAQSPGDTGMPRRKTPPERAEITGAAKKHPERYRFRSTLHTGPLGPKSDWLAQDQATAVWERFRREFPWLQESDRCLVEIATLLRVRLIAGEDIGMAGLNQLRLCVGMMGGTPADRARVTMVEEADDDPLAHYFN
jgi:hypothetical protein